jgi:hypothetical protein
MELILIIVGVIALGFAYSFFVAGAKPVKGSDFYKVSKDGRVLIAAGPKVSALKPTLYPQGLKVKLRGGARIGEFFVHDLVAEAFLPNPAGLPAVRHRDGNVRNNAIDNLEWFTPAEAPQPEPAPLRYPLP